MDREEPWRGGPAPSGIELDPLVGLNDARKPLRSRLLAVPALKARYLDHVRTIAVDWLDWNKLEPVVDQYRSLIENEIEADTRKLTSFAAFQKSVGRCAESQGGAAARAVGLGLKAFAEERPQVSSQLSGNQECHALALTGNR